MPDGRKRLRDFRLLHAENAGIGIAHVDEQFISWACAHHRYGLEAAVETEGVVKIKAEGRNDRPLRTGGAISNPQFRYPGRWWPLGPNAARMMSVSFLRHFEPRIARGMGEET
jgi:hypothetical protein